MKQRKVGFLFNIITICLAVVAIAVGVYSLQQSSLNISGSLGFTAHNATVSAQIKGDAVNGADGTPRAEFATIGSTVNLTKTETTTQLTLTKFYFSNKGESGAPEDIYLKISVTNNFAFNIKAYFDAPTIEGITVSLGEGSSSYVKLEIDTTGDIVLKLSLNKNSSGNYDNLSAENNINLTMHLDKYEDYYVKKITESVYNDSSKAFENVTTNRLCTQLGHGTKEDLNGAEFEQLEWFSFAVKGLDTGKGYMYNNKFYEVGSTETESTLADRWYSLYDVNVNNDLTITVGSENKSLKGHQLWFIQQYTVGGGYAKDSSRNYATGKKFNKGNSQNTANTYADEKNNYQSDIYKYLNGNSENSCETSRKSTYQLDTGIDKDLYYTQILSQDANKRAVNETDTTKYGSITVNNNFTSTFWLLNYTELGLAYNKSLLHSSPGGYIVLSFSIGMKNGVADTSGTVYGAVWWLRSPNAFYYGYAQHVYDSGNFGLSSVDNIILGVRAAFQIQI